MSSAPVLFLMGATATGKTELALELARHFDIEIISVDSAQIYRGMDIGTAKPGRDERASVPHHLIDIIDPAEQYSAWDFVQQSRQLVQEISQRGRIPLLAGGTMMYFHAFEQGLNRLPEADDELRRRLDREARDLGWAVMHARLAEIDAISASRIKPGDTQRIQRALEVYELTGEPLSLLQQGQSSGYPGRITRIILSVEDRAELHQRIEARFLHMLDSGFVEEVSELKSSPDLNLNLPSMRCVGYRQIWQYLEGEYGRQDMIGKAVAATRQLAKRQITWLRKQPAEQAFDCLNYRKDDILRLVETSFSGL